MPRPIASALVLAVLVLPALAHGGEAAVRVETGGGVDTNPLRLSGQPRDEDGYVSLVASGAYAGGSPRGLALRAGLAVGSRTYPNAPDANLVATRLELGAGGPVSRKVRLDGGLALRDLTERGGVRDETGGRGSLEATVRSGSSRVTAAAAFEGLVPRDAALRPYAWYGPSASLGITRPAGEQQLVRVGLELGYRAFPRWSGVREDHVLTGSVEWLRRRPVLLGVAYAFTANLSSVAGGDYRRHRLTARAAVTLPGETTLAVQGSLQRSLYPDGFSSDQPILLAQADAAQNALELRVSRPVGSRLDLALTAAAYGSEQSTGGAPRVPFAREVIGLALSWRAPATAEVPPPPAPRS